MILFFLYVRIIYIYIYTQLKMDILITKETDSTEPSSMQEATHTDRYLHAESSSSTKIDGNSLCLQI